MTTRPNGEPWAKAPPRPSVPPVTVLRLQADAYAQLARQCTAIAVNNDTSPLQAGFQLGVQHVLQKLREGFVHED